MGYEITNLSVRTKLAILILGGSILPAFAGTVFTVENVAAQDYLIDGQPDPESYLVSLSNSSCPHTTQVKVPGSSK